MKRPVGKGGKKEPASKTDDAGDDHEDDHHIWRLAAETIEPLKRRKPRFHPAAEAAKSAPVKKAPAAPPSPKTARPDALSIAPPPVAKAAQRQAPELSTFDRNSARKIRIGRVEIEARVDLHGMHQHEAHAALRSFLARCQSRGLRFVLVITGKGKTTSSEASDARSDDLGRERGVLKRNVPRWLEEPDVRSIVVSYTTAAIQHGGEGALYVHLRTKDRS